jgi:hypothetical protein
MPYYRKPQNHMEWEFMPAEMVIKNGMIVASFCTLPATHPVSRILAAAGLGVE